MYSITFARHHHKYIRPNLTHEGQFTKHFDNLAQIATFIENSKNRLHVVDHNLNLTELRITVNKLISVRTKNI